MKLRLSFESWNYTYALGVQLSRIYVCGVWTPLVVRSTRVTYIENMAEVLASVRKIHSELGQDGGWNYDPYMHGRYDSIENVLALLEDREPDLKAIPDTWMRDLRLVHGMPGFGAADLEPKFSVYNVYGFPIFVDDLDSDLDSELDNASR